MDYSSDMASAGAVGLVVLLVWLLIAVGFLVWYLWAMARLFPRIGLKSTDGWIPIWNQWKLLERAGLPGWVVLLSFVGLSIVPLIMLIIAMHRIGKEYGAGAGYTVLGVFIPPLWATLFANFVGSAGVPNGARPQGNYAPAIPGPPAAFAPNAQPGFVPPPAPPAPPAPQAQPAAPTAFVAQPPAPAPAAPQVNYAPPAQQPWAAAASAAPQYAAPLGGETEADYDRLAAEGFQAPPAARLGQNQAPSPFSWTAARAEQEQPVPALEPEPVIPPVHPLAAAQAAAPPAPPAPPAVPLPPVQVPAPQVAEPVAPAPAPAAAPVPTPAPEPAAAPTADSIFAPEPVRAEPTPAPSVHKATGITGMIDPLPVQSVAAHAGEAEAVAVPMDLDSTVVAPRRNRPAWVLELPDGTEFSLESDVVIGRKPEPIEGSATLPIPDRTRTLSKSHVRLTRDGDRWLVEDLGSTNGLVLLNEDGSESELPQGVRVEATERMLFGTLEVRLRLGGDPA